MAYVILEMKSPLVVVGRNLTNNYRESLQYISGDRVRAGFAKYILQNCPVYEVNKKEIVNNKVRYNWVYYRNEKQCIKCEFSEVCKNFSNMRFSFFYPQGTQVLPFTSMKCKYNKNHGFKDILIRPKETKCNRCIEDTKNEGRMEAAYGFRKGKDVFDIDKVVYTRNSINRYTRTSKEGDLYNIVAVENKYFEGEIEGIELIVEAMEKLNEEKIIRIGSYTSVGMGLAEIKVEDKKTGFNEKVLLKKLNEFNERIREKDYFGEYDKNYNYIPILLISNGKLGLEKENIEDYLSDDEYRKIWTKILKKDINFEFEVERVYTETENYRGYDLSKEFTDIREDIVIINKMGTTILLKTKENLSTLVGELNKLEYKGIGNEKENGFGKVEICNELHLKGEIYE
ncbi:RAMP superfamily CRISPR-associated protein [uncultured Clostridium sp.]|uniref:RAMP superfamily CRISPR-associated protein n=1 Tax=uncultured Clostridium sp. TaxID=59620 RepID=UPI00258E74E1|nr:RAMP superfamily CRISPR-associated protein [uncultured Clostridium sp.]MDU1350324.1 hypothetical protein [Clostridium argentinense]